MEQVDLIKRERSEVDQREVFIHLTEKSEKFKPELSDASQKVANASSLSNDEVHELNRLLLGKSLMLLPSQSKMTC